jgi:hypothetical protein
MKDPNLRFDQIGTSNSGLTRIFWVISRHSEAHLGDVRWFGAWRKYCFYPCSNTVYDLTCLREIADFCERSTMEKRK